MKTYINVTQEAGQRFFGGDISGPFVMLNLLKYKNIADYSHHPELLPNEVISGKAAYKLYMKAVAPMLAKVGGEVLMYGKAYPMVIGPFDEAWDEVLIVRHRNKETFLSFANDTDYLKVVGHRSAALHDSRLMPIEEYMI